LPAWLAEPPLALPAAKPALPFPAPLVAGVPLVLAEPLLPVFPPWAPLGELFGDSESLQPWSATAPPISDTKPTPRAIRKSMSYQG